MTLGIRKLVVLGLVAGVFLLANILLVARWLAEIGAIDVAVHIRREFLTGTAITIIVALLIRVRAAKCTARVAERGGDWAADLRGRSFRSAAAVCR
jgi:hypothetical protein